MASLTIPLVGSIINRNTDPIANFAARDQYFDNCYPEVTSNAISGKSDAFLYKRLGTAHSAGPGGAYRPCNGATVWAGRAAGAVAVFPLIDTAANSLKIMSHAGTTLLTQADVDSTTSTNSSVPITETTISNVANLTFVAKKNSTGTRQAWFFPEGGASTEITDVDFPPNQTPAIPIVGAMEHMDGYAFIMTLSGQIWNSDANTLSGWTASAFNTAQSVPDAGVTVARYKNLIVAFSRVSVEFFQNSGLTPSPLTPVGNAVRHVGAMSSDGYTRTVLKVADTIYWIGHESDSGRVGVYRLNGYTPEKVSNAAVDKYLNYVTASTSISYGFAGAFSMHGMTHVLLDISLGSLTQAPCYCVDTGVWWYMKPATQQSWTACAGLNGIAYFTTNNIGGSGVFATSYEPVFQDNAETMTQTVQIGPIDMGTTKRKTINWLSLLGDKQSAASVVAVSYSDDDGVTFSTPLNIDMTRVRKRLNAGLGSHEGGRIWRFTHSSNTPNRMKAAEIDYTVGNA